MLKEGFNGFCMALADSVPGVSGGTVAFIMGFYDKFIGSINDLVFGKRENKITAIRYLIKLGIGWLIGMVLAVLVLSALFNSHIYTISSLFIGFIMGSIPLIIIEEKESFNEFWKGGLFGLLGILLVVGITLLNGKSGTSTMDLSHFSLTTSIKLFLIGMIAISAMFLPGISGSTLLLIFGAYIPVISAIRGVLGFNLSYIPSLIFFGLGILFGAMTVVKIIQICLTKYRTQMIYMIIGMMIGSLYAIIQGPTTLSQPQVAMSLLSFNPVACLIGLALVIGMQKLKERSE